MKSSLKNCKQGITIQAVVVITNNLEALCNIQDKLEEYFVNFIDNIFKPLNYKFIYIGENNFSEINSFEIIIKLETYYENYRLVFKMRQNEFDSLVESVSVLEQKAKTKDLTPIFQPIFNFF